MNPEELKNENKEGLVKYTYRDNTPETGNGKVVFECSAKDILEADKMYEKETGNDPKKQNFIGCSQEKVVKE